MKTEAKPKRSHWTAMAKAGDPRIPVPEGMSATQAKVWHQAVNGLPADWFGPESVPTLVQYCRHVVRAGQLESAIATLDPLTNTDQFDKLAKLIAGESAKIGMFARSMRLTAQSRMKPDTAHTQASAAAGASLASSRYFDDAGLIPGLQ